MRPLLEITELEKKFGGLSAIHNVNLTIEKGSITSVIGPNGAGKTTLFNMISGFYKPDKGKILFQGKPIHGLSPERIAKGGIARTFQNIRLFKEMTAMENVMVGMETHLRANLFDILLGLKKVKKEERWIQLEAYRLLEYAEIGDTANQLADHLSYGTQRRLEIARALAMKPVLLLLDEPAAGMNPRETKELMAFIQRIRDELEMTIVIIEHDMKLVMGISERIHVLDFGEKIAEGDPDTIRKNERVIEAYLGPGEMSGGD